MSNNPKRQRHVVQAAEGADDTVVLPASVCKVLGLVPGDEIEISVEDQEVRLVPSGPTSVRGVLRDLFPDWDSAERFLSEERSEWSEA